jgi:hypothetical protein
MLVKVMFAFRASYVRPRGRSVLSSDFLSEEVIEIAEIQKNQAEVAYRLLPAKGFEMPDGAVYRRPAPRSLMEWKGRLYWPVLDEGGFRRIDVRRWSLELGKPAGCHTSRSRRNGDRFPDVLGLTHMLHGRHWPTWRMEAVPIRTVVENGRELASAGLQHEAARLLLIGEKLYREGPEPVWLLRADIHHFDVVSQPLRLDAVDCTAPGLFDASVGEESLVPFLHYEIFRADREDDARGLIRARLAADPGRRDCYAAGGRWRIAVGSALPDHDALTPMLLGLHDCVGRMITWSINAVRREVPALRNTPDSEIAAMHGPDYLRRLAGVTMLAPDASARRLSGWVSDVLHRLDGVDTRVDIYGYVETVLRGLRRAADRADRDIAGGLVPLTEEDREDQGPLALLACA